MTGGWHPIAWRRNDRRSSWVEVEGAPVSLATARELIGQNGKPAATGHFFAHRVDGAVTYLLSKPAKRGLA